MYKPLYNPELIDSAITPVEGINIDRLNLEKIKSGIDIETLNLLYEDAIKRGVDRATWINETLNIGWVDPEIKIGLMKAIDGLDKPKERRTNHNNIAWLRQNQSDLKTEYVKNGGNITSAIIEIMIKTGIDPSRYQSIRKAEGRKRFFS